MKENNKTNFNKYSIVLAILDKSADDNIFPDSIIDWRDKYE